MHLWRFSFERHDSAAVDFSPLLSPDETARARRFFFAENRRRYIIGRGWLRVILGRYLHLAPAQLAFRYGSQGKPYLALPEGAEPICFNVAHTESIVLVAVALGRAVGVDVERVRPIAGSEAIAARFFSRRERRELNTAPAAARAATFLRVWTGKEACVKAVGRGLDDDLAEVEVLDFEGRAARRVSVADETGRMAQCWLTEVFPAADHVAAVALTCNDSADAFAQTA